METTEVWRWIWLGMGVLFSVGEIAVAGSFFLLPFGIGAFAASLVAFLTEGLVWSWVAFLGVSAVAFAGLFPLGRRLDRTSGQTGEAVGAGRWVGRFAHVLSDIPGGPGETGMVRVDREEWRAESSSDRAILTGALVKVVDVDGTRLIVEPAGSAQRNDPAGLGEEEGAT